MKRAGYVGIAFLCLLCGCSHRPAPSVRIAWVNVPSLLPFTLAGRQAALLQANANSFLSHRSAFPPPASAERFPSALQPPAGLNLSLAANHVERAGQQARRYAQRYVHMLQLASRLPYALYERSQTEKMETAYRQKLQELRTRLQMKADSKINTLQYQLDSLLLRRAVLNRNAITSTGQTRRDYLQQRSIADQRIAEIDKQTAALRAGVAAAVQAAMAKPLTEAKRDLAASLAAYQKKLAANVDRQVEQAVAEQKQILAQLHVNLGTGILQPLTGPPGAPKLGRQIVMQRTAAMSAALSAALQQTRLAANRTRADVSGELQALLRFARMEARDQAEKTAAKLGCRLVPPHTPGALDITSQTAAALRAVQQ